MEPRAKLEAAGSAHRRVHRRRAARVLQVRVERQSVVRARLALPHEAEEEWRRAREAPREALETQAVVPMDLVHVFDVQLHVGVHHLVLLELVARVVEHRKPWPRRQRGDVIVDGELEHQQLFQGDAVVTVGIQQGEEPSDLLRLVADAERVHRPLKVTYRDLASVRSIPGGEEPQQAWHVVQGGDGRNGTSTVMV